MDVRHNKIDKMCYARDTVSLNYGTAIAINFSNPCRPVSVDPLHLQSNSSRDNLSVTSSAIYYIGNGKGPETANMLTITEPQMIFFFMGETVNGFLVGFCSDVES